MAEEDLPEIPVMRDVSTVREVLDNNMDLANKVLDTCYRFYTRALASSLDVLTKRWLRKSSQPYQDDIDYIAERIGRPGVHMLNLSYEWACTTTVFDAPEEEGGVKMWRALDWKVKGLGDKVVIAKQAGEAGEYWNITYPGFAGVLNAMAEGRFTIAINKAPLPDRGLGYVGDFVKTHLETAARPDHISPPLLLRKVFEECTDYEEAVEILANTPVCVPAIFTVAGVNPGEHCVIERDYEQAIIHDREHCAGNHWLNDEWKATDRPIRSRDRVAVMSEDFSKLNGNFDWLLPPVVNEHTRLAIEANAKTGELRVQGMENDLIVTKMFSLK